MRMAKAADHWRHVYEKPFKIKINKVGFSNLKGFGSGSIDFEGGITAICGGNGVGKTTLLNAISSVLTCERAVHDKSIRNKLSGSSLIGEFVNGTTKFTRSVNLTYDSIDAEPETVGLESVWIDSAYFAPQLVSIFSEMSNLDEMLDAEEPIEATEEELEFLSYTVGKEYESCETYELELENYGVLPFFKVVSEGIGYASQDMGLGELAVHFILWQLHRASKNSIVLMDEPETYLAVRSQESLLDVVAKISNEKKLWTILTTHSPSILKSIPVKHIRLLTRVGDTTQIVAPLDQYDYFLTLGITTQKSGVIFVEDRAAREYAKCWLGRFSSSLLHQFEIVDVQSKENILHQLSDFPNIGRWFKVFGLFDGDQRGEIDKKFNWCYSFLPGSDPPELQLKKVAKQNRKKLAALTGRGLNRINIALANLDGKNYHDWLIEFPEHIGIGYDQLISYLFDLSMADPTIEASIEDAFKELIGELFKGVSSN